MSAIDQNLYEVESELRSRGYRLDLVEYPDGTYLVFEKDDIKTAIKRSEFNEMPDYYVINLVELAYEKLKERE